jgi:thioredoxin-like negative regulator of GroEL
MTRGRVALLAVLAAAGLVVGGILGWNRLQPGAPPPSAPAARTSAAVVSIASEDQLRATLASHPGSTLLDFNAEWCKPCKDLEPRLVDLATRHPELLIASIDVTANETLANAYKADQLPMLVIISGGKEVARQVGAPTLPELERWIAAPR